MCNLRLQRLRTGVSSAPSSAPLASFFTDAVGAEVGGV